MVFDQREAARIIRRPLPELSETPVACASRLLTPVDRFYRRNHFPEIPQVPAEWEIRIVADDRVLRTVGAAEFADLPTSERTTVLECAGNGGSGEHLKRGGFGVARWAGVSVASILAGLRLDAKWRFATFRGRDRGRDPDEDGAVDYYQRSIPLDVAGEGALLASHMNGERLPPDHGYPLRLVIPGWYGSDWIKWVETIELSATASDDVYTERRYRRFQDEDGYSFGPMARDVLVKSMVATPVADAYVRPGEIELAGLAWTRAGRQVTRVDVRLDQGPWQPAEVLEEADGGALVRWQGRVTVSGAGPHLVATRAEDSAGEIQPEVAHGRMYEANHVLTTPVHCLSEGARTGSRRGPEERSSE